MFDLHEVYTSWPVHRWLGRAIAPKRLPSEIKTRIARKRPETKPNSYLYHTVIQCCLSFKVFQAFAASPKFERPKPALIGIPAITSPDP